MGIDKDMADVSDESMGRFFQSCILKMHSDGFCWQLVNIYGPAHDDNKLEFFEEIQTLVHNSEVPILLGGDFNMVRKVEEKSSGNVNYQMIDAFNRMINTTELREIHRSGSRFTWSNKQNPPILCVLHRILASNSWEDKYNFVSVLTAPRIGSDHNPLIVDTGDNLASQAHYFRFNSQWLRQDGFVQWVREKWPARYKYEILDHWHIVSNKLRKAIKGWGQNQDSF